MTATVVSTMSFTLCASLVLAGLALPPAFAQAQPGGERMSEGSDSEHRVQDEIRTIEEEERQAMLGSDIDALTRHWSDTLVVNAPDGKIKTKPDVLDMVKSGRLKYRSFERTIERIAAHGDVAVAMGGETVVPLGGPDAGKTIHRRYTDVYAREHGHWLLIARQATIVP